MKHHHLRIALFFVTTLSALPSFAQQELPWQDTRRQREIFRKTPPVYRADVATFAIGGLSESVGKAPLQKVDYTTLTNEVMVFEGDGIKATVELAPFDSAKHRIDYDMDEKHIIRIDKKPYYGGYGFMPENRIEKITMIIRGDTVAIPETAYNDLFNLEFTYTNRGEEKTRNGVFLSNDKNRVYLYLYSQEKRGPYEVTFIFDDRKFVRRVLDYDL